MQLPSRSKFKVMSSVLIKLIRPFFVVQANCVIYFHFKKQDPDLLVPCHQVRQRGSSASSKNLYTVLSPELVFIHRNSKGGGVTVEQENLVACYYIAKSENPYYVVEPGYGTVIGGA